MIFDEYLYKRVILRNLEKYSKLKIISGYASSTFLEGMLSQVGDICLDLYIGMSQEGISKSNHDKFKELNYNNENINIYYQIKGDSTHIKLYHFYGVSSSVNYIGSANFSENGFKRNNELLIETNEDCSRFFERQYKNSLLCTDKRIEEFITFYDEKYEFLENEDYIKNKEVPNSPNEENNSENIHEKIEIFNKNFNVNVTIPGISLPIVTDEKANSFWWQTGINSVFINKESHLIKSNKHSLSELFPKVNFKVIAFDGKTYRAELKGNFNRELHIENWNFYEEIAKIIGLKERRPIEKEDLIEVGFNSFYFIKKEENVYIMTMINDF